jgi:hypothetical protein
LTHMHNLRNPIGQKIEQTKNTRRIKGKHLNKSRPKLL